MDHDAFYALVDTVKRQAHGHWTDILRQLGVDARILNRRNQPCPRCGGTDRFQYTDKFGEGNYHCRHCGAGGGLKLLQACTGWDFRTALARVATCLHAVAPVPAVTPAVPAGHRMRALAKRLWEEAHAVVVGDDVDRYLCARGLQLPTYPKTLRCHPCLGYYDKDPASGKSRKRGEYPAMLACIQGPDGHAITLHRTYLQDGGKAFGRQSKKILSGGIHGAAVRLAEPGDTLALTEGIETALAVFLRTGIPVWAALSAGNLERLWLPPTVRHVGIYADNDADAGYDGQASAFLLARRLTKEATAAPRRQVAVYVPRHVGCDWADVWARQHIHAGT